MKTNSIINPVITEAANELSSGLTGNRCNGYRYSEEFLKLAGELVEAHDCLGRLMDGLGDYRGVMLKMAPEEAALANKLLRRLMVTASKATQATYVGMARDQHSSVRAAARRAHKDLTDQVRITTLDSELK